jgi:hypothetical protein
MVAAPFVRGAFGACMLAFGFWDHCVHVANMGVEAVEKSWA